MAVMKESDYLEHYGILRRSGRYPWGSGGTQSARNRRFLDEVARLRKEEGLSDTEIARGFGITRNELTAAKSIAINEQRQQKINQAQRLKDKGWGFSAIGRRMGLNESSVRALLEPGAKDKADVLTTVANMLKDQVEKKTYLDVGTQTERYVGVSTHQFKTALAMLKEQGYEIHPVKLEQLGTGEKTRYQVLTKPGVKQSEVWANRDKIRSIAAFSEDGGRSMLGLHDPISISSKRIKVNWAEDGGNKADGVIYVRPGVKDVSIGSSHYAQVRMKVDGTHYIKGMAVYKDDLPAGVDLVVNTNKARSNNKLDAMKPLKDDPDNPFGAVVRQRIERDPKTGVEKVTSAMNIVGLREGQYEEGGWDVWSRNLPSQMLSKQSPELIKGQLALTHERRKVELEKIKNLTNPSVRKRLLESFADDADSAAVHLQAASMPKQATKVLLPVPSMKDHEVYAPSFRNGERVALVRFPHGGTFEIPELTVNNRNPEAKRLLGSHAADAIGINHKVAHHLSGADFDGDAVLVIPNNEGKIKTTPALEGLKGFDPQRAYPAYEGMKPLSPSYKQTLMGDVSNLITDMTIRGANTTELAQAVRHSMVVIDAEKHNLDWRSSARDNGIPALKEKYQGRKESGRLSGASTLISLAGARIEVPKREPRRAKEGGPVDKATGKRVFVRTGEKDSRGRLKTQRSKRLAETDDAHSLSSGLRVENLYADHSNRLKAMANESRKEAVNTKTIPYSSSAFKTYKQQVNSLDEKLAVAERNAPLERQAQVIAGATYAIKRRANPHMDQETKRKIKFQALNEARNRTGAKKTQVVITPEEWHAIQAGAISKHKLDKILKHADIERVKELATPRQKVLMTSVKTSRAKSMLASGYTQAEVADALGVSLTTLKDSLA